MVLRQFPRSGESATFGWHTTTSSGSYVTGVSCGAIDVTNLRKRKAHSKESFCLVRGSGSPSCGSLQVVPEQRRRAAIHEE